mmetsp:Transcript_48507/g.161832  ORF Transcript_48507/g.161832 Transcript_48507/m.161832 type:complete len:309 (-) Transcript_48507:20-946(-)
MNAMSPARSLARRSYTCAVGSPLTSLRVASLSTITTTSSIVLLLSSSRCSAARSSMDCSRRRCLFCDGAGELRVAMRLVGTQALTAERPPLPRVSLPPARRRVSPPPLPPARRSASARTSSAAVATIWTSRPAVREVSAVDAAASASSNGRSPSATWSMYVLVTSSMEHVLGHMLRSGHRISSKHLVQHVLGLCRRLAAPLSPCCGLHSVRAKTPQSRLANPHPRHALGRAVALQLPQLVQCGVHIVLGEVALVRHVAILDCEPQQLSNPLRRQVARHAGRVIPALLLIVKCGGVALGPEQQRLWQCT